MMQGTGERRGATDEVAGDAASPGPDVRLLRGQYWLTRVVFLRCLGLVYMVAFLVALNDNGALLGENGLLPATRFMERVEHHLASLTPFEKVLKLPTVFWFTPPTAANLWWVAAVGVAVSGAVAARGAANFPAMALLWVLYHSLVNVGQAWYSFGWESQLLETGFLGMFLVPWLSLSRFPEGSPPPLVCVWGYRWLLFRIMLGAGLIKMRGDACWQDLTCMDYHYQTQPNPNPLSSYLHHMPGADWHKAEVVVNHIVELVVPWALLLGRRQRCFAGAVQILFQAAIVVSGNLSFLNWLTALPAIFSFDDLHVARLFSAQTRRRACLAARGEAGGKEAVVASAGVAESVRVGQPSDNSRHSGNGIGEGAKTKWPLLYLSGDEFRRWRQRRAREATLGKALRLSGILVRWAANGLLVVLVVRGSIPVVKNMAGMGVGQVMNTSFDSLRIVNTYGNFGSVTKTRGEVVLKGTRHPDPFDRAAKWTEYGDFRIVNTYGAFGSVTKTRAEVILKGTRHHDPLDRAAQWKEYDFKCKPGDVDQRPCIISPFHYRLDWQMWFAAFQNYGTNPWLVNLAAKLLSRDESTRALAGSLLRHDPFSSSAQGVARAGSSDAVSAACAAVDGGKDVCRVNSGGEGEEGGVVGETGEGMGQAGTGAGGPPLFIKADLYVYEYTPPNVPASVQNNPVDEVATSETTGKSSSGSSRSSSGAVPPNGEERGKWWIRRLVREYMPPVSLENSSVQQFLRSHGLE